MNNHAVITIMPVTSQGKLLNAVINMFNEYAVELNEDISFQHPGKEFNNPLVKYAPPKGALFVALYNEEPAGCVALHSLPQGGTCEMKRMYVRPEFRKYSIGRLLANAILDEAIRLGYERMVLDTLQKLEPAIRLYRSLGFKETLPYYNNPLSNVLFMEKKLNDSE